MRGKELVDDGKQLHDTFVQVEVFAALEQERVLASVAANHGEFFGFGLGSQYLYSGTEFVDGNGVVSARDRTRSIKIYTAVVGAQAAGRQ